MNSISISLRKTLLLILASHLLFLSSVYAIPFHRHRAHPHSLSSPLQHSLHQQQQQQHLLLLLLHSSSSIHQTIPIATGFTFDLCRSDNQCTTPRLCFNSNLNSDSTSQPCTTSSQNCNCRPPVLPLCATSFDCIDGDRCTRITTETSNNINLCVSCWLTGVLENNGAFCLIDNDTTKCVGQFVTPLIPLCVIDEQEITNSSTTTTTQTTEGNNNVLSPTTSVSTSSNSTSTEDTTNNDNGSVTPLPSISPLPPTSVTTGDNVPPSSDVPTTTDVPTTNDVPTSTEMPTTTDIPSPTNTTNNTNTTSEQQQQQSTGGYTADFCTTDSDCVGTRSCLLQPANSTQVAPCPISITTSNSPETPSCRCLNQLNGVLSLVSCPSGSTQCKTGDRCVRNFENDNQRCLSCQSATSQTAGVYCYADADISKCVGSIPTTTNMTICPDVSVNSDNNDSDVNDDDDEPVCVAVSSLVQHLSVQDMVFDSHRTASVLCDEKENCATPGHIVEYRGRLMMMKTYCEVIQKESKMSKACVRRVRWVNSPRMKMGLRIPSKHDELSFTAVAARFGTKAEERLFQTLTRFGV